MNKSESKYFNTAIKMDEAFLDILNQKDFEFITVKEICEKAKVNRSTFYLHYETLDDLLLEANDYICNKFTLQLDYPQFDAKEIDTMPLEKLYLITPNFLLPWLNSIKQNKKLFKTIIKHFDTLKMSNNYHQLFTRVIEPILSRFNVPSSRRKYMFVFYIEGVLSIVKEWIKNNCDVTVEEMCQIVMECVRSYETKRMDN